MSWKSLPVAALIPHQNSNPVAGLVNWFYAVPSKRPSRDSAAR
jgi:hypothetical protein